MAIRGCLVRFGSSTASRSVSPNGKPLSSRDFLSEVRGGADDADEGGRRRTPRSRGRRSWPPAPRRCGRVCCRRPTLFLEEDGELADARGLEARAVLRLWWEDFFHVRLDSVSDRRGGEVGKIVGEVGTSGHPARRSHKPRTRRDARDTTYGPSAGNRTESPAQIGLATMTLLVGIEPSLEPPCV